MNFDLISDLHLDYWPNDKQINFKGLGTSLTCVVAGDVSQNLKLTRDFLYKLSDAYQAVIYIDGNHEHKPYMDIDSNCEWLEKETSKKSNITYLWDSTCVFGTTAFVGANSWWTYDYLEPMVSRIECMDAFCLNEDYENYVAIELWDRAIENSEFLSNIVRDFNKVDRIEEIVVITHTLPRRDLVEVPPSIKLPDLGKLYNSALSDVFAHDTGKKISTWCFGHYHAEAVDKKIDGVRYVSNPRGTPYDTTFPIYYPKLINL